MKSARELKELAQRLADEPDNQGLRVTIAGHLREAGRVAEAVEHYRTVAIAYRDLGRTLQAIAVCKSLLAIAPDDARCKALLAELEAPARPPPAPPEAPTKKPRVSAEPATPAPPRRPEVLLTRLSSGSLDETPLPVPLPHHVADPTSSIQKISEVEDTNPRARGSSVEVTEPASDDDLIDTHQRSRISTGNITRLEPAPDDSLTHPMSRLMFGEEDPSDPPALAPPPGDTEDEMTVPVELLAAQVTDRVVVLHKKTAVDPFSTTVFSHLPVERRAAALSRFHRRTIAAGDTLIARNATNHPFILVLRGELEVRPHAKPPFSVGPGEYAGEDSLLSRSAATATVVATKDTHLLMLLPGDFYELVGAFPALWAELTATAAARS